MQLLCNIYATIYCFLLNQVTLIYLELNLYQIEMRFFDTAQLDSKRIPFYENYA